MFKLKVNDTFDWTVKFDWPVNGKHQTQTFEATFRRLERDQMKLLQPVEGESTDEANARLTEFLREAIVSVSLEVLDASNNPIEDMRARIELIIKDQVLGGAMLTAFVEGISGRIRKN